MYAIRSYYVSDSETGKVLVSYQPVKFEAVKDLPETVKRPVPPEDMATTEELYLTGSRIQQFGNPTLNAMDYFEEALRRDPSDIRTNIAVGNTYLKNVITSYSIHYTKLYDLALSMEFHM